MLWWMCIVLMHCRPRAAARALLLAPPAAHAHSSHGPSTLQALSKAAATIKAGAADLSADQAIHAAWGLALLGADKDALAPLFAADGAVTVQVGCCASARFNRLPALRRASQPASQLAP